MCGVVGMFAPAPGPVEFASFEAVTRESLARGRHACGFAYASSGAVRAERFPDLPSLSERLRALAPTLSGPLVGHTRYSTSGDWRDPANNQPILAGGRALAFNGVISQADRPGFEAEFGVSCASDNDGEVFLRKLEAGADPVAFVASLRGSFAGCWLEPDGRAFALRNGRRPLWVLRAGPAAFVASTRDILRRAGLDPSAATEVPPLRLIQWGPPGA